MRPGHLTAEQRALLDRLLDAESTPTALPRIRSSGVSRSRFPLSFAQQQLWFFDQLEPGSPLYNLVGSARLIGEADPEVIGRCLTEVVRRHEALRTTFHSDAGEPWARVEPVRPVEVPVVDLSGLGPAERAAAVAAHQRAEAHRSFDLTTDPMLRVMLLKTGAEASSLILCLHHIAADGWSLGILLRELAALYLSFSTKNPSPLPELRVQYADYTVWQRDEQTASALREHVSYWERHLAGAPLLDLPTDRPRRELRSFAGESVCVALPADLTRRLRQLADAERATQHMVVLAGFVTLLARWSGQRHIVVGTSIAGRNRFEIADLIGFFVNTLPLRIDASGDPTFRELLGRVRETCLAGYAHQDAPFEQVVVAVQPDRDRAAHTPLFRHTLVLHDAPHPALQLPGLRIEVDPLYTDTAKFELRLELTPDAGGGLSGVAEYSPELFNQESVQRLMTALRCLLADAVAAPDRTVGNLKVIPDAQRELLISEFSGARAEAADRGCVHEMFERQARQAPSAVAITDGSRHLSYGEVDGRANQLARYLRGQGAGPEDLIGVCLPRGAEQVITLLAVLKAGAGFVALDPADPDARLRQMLRDCGAWLVVTRPGLIDLDEAAGSEAARAITLIDLAAAMRAAAELPVSSPGVPVLPASLAYACYTSGSTGTPKGVMIEHAALANLIAWRRDKFALTAADVALARTPLGFDVSIGEWAWPLTTGARVVLANHEDAKDPRYLVDLIRAERITVCSVVPSLLQALIAEPAAAGCADSLRLVMCGGELLTADLAARFAEVLPGVRLVNLYGPTEATIDVTTRFPRPGQATADRVPIGTPIAGTRLYVLDEKLEPVPVGVSGEMYIGGIQLSRGYLGRPGLTADVFGPDPFVPGARLYRTGDKVRWLSDGSADFIGRVDDQLKIRGHRVEPAEIEAVLASHPDVTGSAVVAGHDSEGAPRLAAYLTTREGADAEATTGALRTYLRERLPDYMIPATLTILPAWPVGSNGKLDRAALIRHKASPSTGAQPPRTQAEQRLARIWCDVLKLSSAGVHDNFFDLGGHSLLAARLVARVRAEFGVDLPLGTLLRDPTIAVVAASLEAAQPPLPSIPRAPRPVRSADGITEAPRPREQA